MTPRFGESRRRREFGGITIDTDEVAVGLVAAEYAHPALGDRAIVRLVPEPLLPAEERTLDVVGLAPVGRTPVGHVRRRAIGFPAWPILTDPANARHALELVGDLSRVARLAGSKPGQAKERLDGLIATLDARAPHFLPTFCEEAARIFLGVENRTYALQYFGKARDAERRHGLAIDEARHREVLLEFAYAGAISGKELTNEARSLAQRCEPREAYAAFATLCIQRVRGGLLPYQAMQKDLARLARAAGLDPVAEDVRVAAELVRAASIKAAAGHFWTGYDRAIREAARVGGASATADEIRRALLLITPREFTVEGWLTRLEEVGALEIVRAGGDPGFAPRMLNWITSYERRIDDPNDDYSPRLVALLAEPGARTPGVRIRGSWLGAVPVDLLDVLAAQGTTITLQREEGLQPPLDMVAWSRREQRRDLSALAADPRMASFLRAGVERLIGEGRLPAALESAGTRQVCLDLLEGAVTPLAATSGLHRLQSAHRLVRQFRRVDDPAITPLVERADAVLADTVTILTTTLRRGLPHELAWPAFEKAYAEATQHARNPWQRTILAHWPDALITGRDRIWAVGHDTAEPLTNWTGRELTKAVQVGDELGLSYHNQNWDRRVQWSGDRVERTPRDPGWVGWAGGYRLNLPVAGGRLHADGLSRPGAPDLIHAEGHLLHDGEHYWRVADPAAAALRELDPATGRAGRTSLPDWLAEQQRRHPDHTLDPSHCQLLPVTDETAGSLVSTADGFHRCAVLVRDGEVLVVDAAGDEHRYRAREGESLPFGVVRRPGGGHWLLAEDRLIDPGTSESVPLDGPIARVPLPLWHQLVARDAPASGALRTTGPETAARLIEAAHALRGPARKAGAPDPLIDVVAGEFACSDAILAKALTRLVRQCVALACSTDAPHGRTTR